MEQRPVCLSIGGSDSCAGAGIQADLRVFEALEVHGCSAITALTAQTPGSISRIQGSTTEQFEAEIRAITNYYSLACIKTGMLFDEAHLNKLIFLKQSLLQNVALIVDPVLISSSGKYLFDAKHAKSAYENLIPLATLWTPNLQEAEFFLGMKIDDPIEAVSSLLLQYKTPVLLKGGHGNGQTLRDIYCDLGGNIEIFEHPKKDLNNDQLHGTGCRLASSIASFIACGKNLSSSVFEAHRWLQGDLKDNISTSA